MPLTPSDDLVLRRLRGDLAALDLSLKALRARHLLAKYRADQPRVPAGQSDGGQWTDTGGGGGASGGSGRVADESPRVTTIRHATGDPAVRSHTSAYADGTRIAARVADGGALKG